MTGAPRKVRRRAIVAAAVVLVAAIGGAYLGYFLRLDLPDVRSLEDYAPPVMARVVGTDGSEVATFAQQRRILIGTPDIPVVFRHALVAAEDSTFESHSGIAFRGIARAAWNDLIRMRAAQGASTITQQLARNLFLRSDKNMRRKIQEAILAIEIERSYTKEEILRFYCNQVYMGHGRYGIEAASRFYFGKPAKDMVLAEAALLAGVIQRPEGLSPIKNPAGALARRNYVLARMLDEGYLSREEAQAGRDAPLGVVASPEISDLAPYFVEEVRRTLQAKYGEAAIYETGMKIQTTVDPRMQDIANRAVDRGLRELDKRRGWRGVAGRIPPGEDPAGWEPPGFKERADVGDVVDGVVTAVARGSAQVRIRAAAGTLGREQIAWTRRADPKELLHTGDLVRVRIVKLDGAGGAVLALEQEPNMEAALIAIEPSTGEVKALVGGRDFAHSEFDRATQARRQTGSAFKPFVYAAALASGKSLADRIVDEPTVFVDRGATAPYQPENYGEKYYGLVTLRESLEHSANIATVKLLLQTGFDPVIEMAQRMGITSSLRPYPSLALGAFEVSLIELTSAYGTFANQGVRVAPHMLREVYGADGSLLERDQPEVREAVSPQIAYLMTRALEGVISDGTGAAAATLGRPLAGKTGTTDDFTDAWFVGYAPDLAVGVWVGFDAKKSLGSRETGALAALPIWKAFMEETYEGRPAEEFVAPAGVSMIAIDRRTGLRASPAAGCDPIAPETFLTGTEPTVYCSASEHLRLALPHALQRFPLDDEGALIVPADELEAIAASEPSVHPFDGGTRIEVVTAAGIISLAVRPAEPSSEPALPDAVRTRMETEDWRGKDGRKARVILLH